MTTCSYAIEGGDYERAGSASRGLKELVKALGVDPEAMRRIMIATYEAEMNVVIHARRGQLIAVIEPDRIGAEVVDQGPGIADIEMAMTEGFSTASCEARALGFGAGLGLPNIRRQSDDFTLESEVGRGTRLRFGVRLGRSSAVEPRHNSLRVRGEQCSLCGRCVIACPTGALRVRPGGVSLLTHLCIECTECIGVCPHAALDVEGDDGEVSPRVDTLVALPAALFPGGAPIHAGTASQSIAASGYKNVQLTTPWARSLRSSLASARRSLGRPALSPACPAVVELVRIRFPALLEDIPSVAGPLEAASAALPGADALPLCPAGRSALLAGDVSPARIVSPGAFRRRLVAASKERTGEGTRPRASSACVPSAARGEESVAIVTGMRQVLRTLSALEDGRVWGPEAIEPYACDGGCFGSALLGDVCAALAERAFSGDARSVDSSPAPVAPLAKRSHRRGYRLDDDMAQAMKKLASIRALRARLPGRDCGHCGAPSCYAFAEDVVLARVAEKACPHRVEGAQPCS